MSDEQAASPIQALVPAILLAAFHGLLWIVLLGMMLRYVPTFLRIFEDFEAQLPLMTRWAVEASYFSAHYWFLILPFIAVVCVVDLMMLYALYRRPQYAMLRWVWSAVMLLVPLGLMALTVLAVYLPMASLITDEWTSPAWHYWQGGSPSYYTHNWNDNRDCRVFSTQVQSMNWIFMLEEAWRVNPDFWFEISTWDGNEIGRWMEGVAAQTPEQLVRHSSAGLSPAQRKQIDDQLVRKSKALQYLVDGQTYPPQRAGGWVQFGMWLLRPRAVREFRGHATPLLPVEPYWMETVKAVDRVWADETLKEFWRHGRLVPNTAHRHPYQIDVSAKYKDTHRWYLLDTDLDPARPWGPNTEVPVFSLALLRGEEGRRQWLVYVHSPLVDRRGVEITIPDFGKVIVDVPRAGAFYLVDQRSGTVTPILSAVE